MVIFFIIIQDQLISQSISHVLHKHRNVDRLILRHLGLLRHEVAADFPAAVHIQEVGGDNAAFREGGHIHHYKFVRLCGFHPRILQEEVEILFAVLISRKPDHVMRSAQPVVFHIVKMVNSRQQSESHIKNGH